MNDQNLRTRWDECRLALLDAVEFQRALGGELYDQELVADFVRENDFTNALLFGAALVRPGDDRAKARELAVLLLPQAEFLIAFERHKPTDPSPLPEYLETLQRLRSVVRPRLEEVFDEAGVEPVSAMGSPTTLLRFAQLRSVLDVCLRREIGVLGIEGFELGDGGITPQTDVILDLSTQKSWRQSIEDARRFVELHAGTGLLAEIELVGTD